MCRNTSIGSSISNLPAHLRRSSAVGWVVLCNSFPFKLGSTTGGRACWRRGIDGQCGSGDHDPFSSRAPTNCLHCSQVWGSHCARPTFARRDSMVLSLKRPTHGFSGFGISEPFFMLRVWPGPKQPVVELLRGFLLCRPTFPLRVSDSLSGGSTHLVLLANNWCSCLRNALTGQQSTGLL